MAIRPKIFVAARDFSYGAESYSTGDVVPHGRTLRHLIELGGFVAEQERGTAAPRKESADG